MRRKRGLTSTSKSSYKSESNVKPFVGPSVKPPIKVWGAQEFGPPGSGEYVYPIGEGIVYSKRQREWIEFGPPGSGEYVSTSDWDEW